MITCTRFAVNEDSNAKYFSNGAARRNSSSLNGPAVRGQQICFNLYKSIAFWTTLANSPNGQNIKIGGEIYASC